MTQPKTELEKEMLEEFDKKLGYISNIGVQCDVLTKDNIKSFILIAMRKAYREGHIDHQLFLESGTKQVAEDMTRRVSGQAGEQTAKAKQARRE